MRPQRRTERQGGFTIQDAGGSNAHRSGVRESAGRGYGQMPRPQSHGVARHASVGASSCGLIRPACEDDGAARPSAAFATTPMHVSCDGRGAVRRFNDPLRERTCPCAGFRDPQEASNVTKSPLRPHRGVLPPQPRIVRRPRFGADPNPQLIAAERERAEARSSGLGCA